MDRQDAETFPAQPFLESNVMQFRKTTALLTKQLAIAAGHGGRPLVGDAVYCVSDVVSARSLSGGAAPARLDRAFPCPAPGPSA
jgi:hypothetical protein